MVLPIDTDTDRSMSATQHGADTEAIAVGVDLGATKFLAVSVDSRGRTLGEGRQLTPEHPADAIDLVIKAVETVRLEGAAIRAVGLGCPGWVDKGGVLRFAANLGGLVNLDVRRILEDRLDVFVHVDNDANCAAWGEFTLGAARNYSDAVVLTLGTGIGAGVIVGGCLVRGANGLAGEVGHMVVEGTGPLCNCGRKGCWEVLASGRALTQLGQRAARDGRAARVLALAGGRPDKVQGEHVSSAAIEGDESALNLLEIIARWVAVGIANIAHAFDPQVVVIGGGLASAGSLFLEATRRALQGEIRLGPGVELVLAELGERAGAVGAACLASSKSTGA